MTTVPGNPHLSGAAPDKALSSLSATARTQDPAINTHSRHVPSSAPEEDLPDSILLLQSTTPRAFPKLIPALKADLRSAGVWLGGMREISPQATALSLEIHRHVVQSLYIVLIRSGLHLSRSAHTALAALCSRDPPFNGRSVHLLLEVRRTPALGHLSNPVSPISA